MNGLTYIRKSFGFTMKDLGEKLDVSANTINLWEKGKLEPTEERIEQLEEFLKLPRELFNKQIFDDDEIFMIENARFNYVITKYKKSKFNRQFVDDYLGEFEKTEELIYLLDSIIEAHDKLDGWYFAYMVEAIIQFINSSLQDINNISKLQFLLNSMVYSDEDPTLKECSKEDLIGFNIRYLLNQYTELKQPDNEEEQEE